MVNKIIHAVIFRFVLSMISFLTVCKIFEKKENVCVQSGADKYRQASPRKAKSKSSLRTI